MKKQNLIAVKEICTTHGVERQFLVSLQESGLLEIITVDRKQFVEVENLPRLEKYIRMHYELEINMAGIEAIASMLERVSALQEKMQALMNRLRFYE